MLPMKSILLFFKSQKSFFTLLILSTVFPFYLCSVYLPEIPLTQYFFLILILCLKIIIFNEKILEKRLTPQAIKQLQKELSKYPSKNEIYKRVMFHIRSRDLSMLICTVGIIIIGIIYRRF